MSNDPVLWNPYNQVVQDHRDGTIDHAQTNAERAKRGLPVPWTPTIDCSHRDPYWWMPRRTDPLHSGWFYVREASPRFCVGMRYFDNSNQSWWAFSAECKSLVPNESFHDWLTIPNISDKQGNPQPL